MLALAFGLLAQVAVVAMTLYRWPARMFWPGEFTGFAVVSHRDGYYWSVDVTTLGWCAETFVTAEPAASFQAAQTAVEHTYEAMQLFDDSMTVWQRILLPQRLPGWLKLAGHDPEPYRVVYRPEHFAYQVEIRAVGWPWRCLWGQEVWAAVLPDYRLESERQTKARQARWSNGQLKFSENAYPLPCFPIWRGIVLDVLASGLPFLGLQIAAGAWQARRRRRRGRCVVCGYDRSGIADGVACPECEHVPRG